MKYPKRITSTAVAAIIGFPVVAHAQQLEEVFVTATKRAASVQDIPIAVTAISGVALESANFSDLRSLVSLVPSVSIANTQAASREPLKNPFILPY